MNKNDDESFSHTRYVEEAPAEPKPEKPPVAQWPFGGTYTVNCQDKYGEKFSYELTEHSTEAAIKAVLDADDSVVRAMALVK